MSRGEAGTVHKYTVSGFRSQVEVASSESWGIWKYLQAYGKVGC